MNPIIQFFPLKKNLSIPNFPLFPSFSCDPNRKTALIERRQTPERATRREANREVKLSEIATESLSTTSRALKISARLTGGSDSKRLASVESVVASQDEVCKSRSFVVVVVAEIRVRVSELVVGVSSSGSFAPLPSISRGFYPMRHSDFGLLYNWAFFNDFWISTHIS